jgi:rubrerythrin
MQPSHPSPQGRTTEDAVREAYSDASQHPDPTGEVTQRVLAAVLDHTQEEAVSIATYRRLGETTRDPVLAAAMQLLVADEERHHQFFRDLAIALQDALEWRATPDAQAADSVLEGSGSMGLARELGALADAERRAAQDLRQLAFDERAVNAPVPSLLLEYMAMDSDKHARLLNLLQRRAAGPRLIPSDAEP